jgi:hypothetical protein
MHPGVSSISSVLLIVFLSTYFSSFFLFSVFLTENNPFRLISFSYLKPARNIIFLQPLCPAIFLVQNTFASLLPLLHKSLHISVSLNFKHLCVQLFLFKILLFHYSRHSINLSSFLSPSASSLSVRIHSQMHRSLHLFRRSSNKHIHPRTFEFQSLIHSVQNFYFLLVITFSNHLSWRNLYSLNSCCIFVTLDSCFLFGKMRVRS